LGGEIAPIAPPLAKRLSDELGCKTSAQLENFDCQYHGILPTGRHWNFALHFRTF